MKKPDLILAPSKDFSFQFSSQGYHNKSYKTIMQSMYNKTNLSGFNITLQKQSSSATTHWRT